jgi:elongation factor G
MPDRTESGPFVADPAALRNVVLVGPAGSGKTTLLESLLSAAGAIGRPGDVTAGSTVSDFEDAEKRIGRSVSLSLASFQHADRKINVLDTPGYSDFVGELRAGLRAADAALFVISASDGVDEHTRLVWEECAAVGMPRAVVVTHLDKERADFDELVAICQRVFGDGVLPLYLPMAGDDGKPAGTMDLLTQTVHDYSSGSYTTREPDPEHLPLIEDARNALIEGVITESEDETLLDRFMSGEQIDVETLVDDMETAVARGTFYPVLPAAASIGYGTRELLALITDGFPSPLEHALPTVTGIDGSPADPLECDADGRLAAEVVKTVSDPYVGRISLVRVFSGTLRPDTVLHVSGHFLSDRGHSDHDLDERCGAVSAALGKTMLPLAAGVAGDVVAVAKLMHAETGDTLSDKGAPLLMEPWTMPDPLLPVAVVAHAKSDEDKMSEGLARLAAEDPTLRLEKNAETGQVVLWCMGETHSEVVMERLRTRYGVNVDAEPVRIALRETFRKPATGRGRLVKQSGGHGQFAICEVQVEPLPAGSGFEFVDKVVGGAVPRQFIPSVEKGLHQQLEKGLDSGYPVVDIRVTLVDGKAHSVDSSDMAFQQAGGLALRDAASNGALSLLEPIDRVTILVTDEYVGAVMSDLSGRRGRLVGTESIGAGRTSILADVPQLELSRYAIELRSLTHGTASFTRDFSGYEPMPSQVAAKHRGEQ